MHFFGSLNVSKSLHVMNVDNHMWSFYQLRLSAESLQEADMTRFYRATLC